MGLRKRIQQSGVKFVKQGERKRENKTQKRVKRSTTSAKLERECLRDGSGGGGSGGGGKHRQIVFTTPLLWLVLLTRHQLPAEKTSSAVSSV